MIFGRRGERPEKRNCQQRKPIRNLKRSLPINRPDSIPPPAANLKNRLAILIASSFITAERPKAPVTSSAGFVNKKELLTARVSGFILSLFEPLVRHLSMRECPRCEYCFEDDVLVCSSDAANTKHTLPGGRLLASRYLLEKRLGRGAMGQVYLARDKNFVTRRVALKTVRPDILSEECMQEGEAIARFEREARAAASVRHPNVVDVTDFGQSPEGVFFLVMEYVEGETLYQLLRREGTLNTHRTLSLLRQVVAGVDAAHDEGILHRDLKPANIFIMQHRRKG